MPQHRTPQDRARRAAIAEAAAGLCETTMGAPVHVALPPQEPDPVPGCEICADVATQRAEAKTHGDGSRLTDCNIEIRLHPHGRSE